VATGDPGDIRARLKSVLPAGWFEEAGATSGTSASPTPILDAMLAGFGAVLSWAWGLLSYARAQTRLGTASDGWLELAAQDYFGEGNFPRFAGESDPAYAARILANLLPQADTRAALSAAIAAVTGRAPRITELWRPLDTGCWDGVGSLAWDAPGLAWDQTGLEWDGGQTLGAFYWDVDTAATPFRWAGRAPFQAFIDSIFPSAPLLGTAQIPYLDHNLFWDAPGSAFMDLPGLPAGEQQLIAAIRNTHVFGTQIWLRFPTNPNPAVKGGPIYGFDDGLAWDHTFWF
jgi:hypothetical protein